VMAATSLETPRRKTPSALALVVTTRTAQLPARCVLLAARIALTWIFIYYGAGKLFGAFNGPGIHRTALYFSNTAHLHPGESSQSSEASSSSAAPSHLHSVSPHAWRASPSSGTW
jgi:hypothetical protein